MKPQYYRITDAFAEEPYEARKFDRPEAVISRRVLHASYHTQQSVLLHLQTLNPKPIPTTEAKPQAVLALRSGDALEVLWGSADLNLVRVLRWSCALTVGSL